MPADSFILYFESPRGVVLEPRWLASQRRRVKPGDRGAARSLIEDDFPFRSRAVLFELGRGGEWAIRFNAPPEGETGWEESGRGVLRSDSGAVAVADEARVVEALAEWRDGDRIRNEIGAVWAAPPGRHEIVVRRRRKQAQVAVALRLLTEEESRALAPDLEDEAFAEPVTLEITDELDLHAFSPKEAKAVIEEYCRLAAGRGYTQVRIIHGKGVGELRRLAHSVLSRHPRVRAFHDAPLTRGGAGATIVDLR